MEKPFGKLLAAAVLFFAGLLLPYVSGMLGWERMLLLMQIPVLLAGFLLPMNWAVCCAVAIPVANTVVWGVPTAFGELPLVLCEMIAYAAFANFYYTMVNWKVYPSLFMTMLSGRAVLFCAASIYGAVSGGAVRAVPYLAAAVSAGWPGMLLQAVAVPAVLALVKRRGGGIKTSPPPGRPLRG